MFTTLIPGANFMSPFKKIIILLVIGGFLVITNAVGKMSDTEYVERARQYQNKGDLQAAVIDLKNALQQNPANVEARLLLGTLYVRLGNGASAQKELEFAKAGGIADELVSIPLAKAYLIQGNAQQILANIWPKDDMRPEIKAELLTLRGNAYQLQGKLDEADKAFQEALLQQPNQIGALLALGRNALQRDRLKEVKQWLDKAQAAAPNSPEVWQLQGDYEQKQTNWSSAEAAYNKVLALDSGNLHARISLVAVLVAENKMDDAGKALDAVQGKARRHPQVLYYTALIAFLKGNYKLAQDRLQELFRVNPDYGPALYLMGVTQYSLGNMQQADELAQRLSQQFPDNPLVQRLKGLVELKKGPLEPSKLREEARSLVAQFPKDLLVLKAVAETLQAQGKPEEAAKYLKKVTEFQPDSAETHLQLGETLLQQNKPEQAMVEFEKAKKLGAPSPNIDYLLISSYLAAKSFDRALAALQSLQEKEAQNATMWNLTGIAYAGKEQLDKAQEAWRKALELAPGDPGTTTNLARLALARKDPETARRYYQQALAKRPDDLPLLLGSAELERQQGNKESYARQLDDAIKKQPKALQPRLLRAGTYLQENDPSKARGLLVEVQETYGSNPDFLLMMGQIDLVSKDTNAAIRSFNKLLTLQPDSATGLYWLAGAYSQKGDPKQMQEPLFKALALQPDNPLAGPILAPLPAQARDNKEAAQLLQALQEKFPNNRQVIAATGQLALQRRDYQRAVQVYQQGLNLFPDDAGLTYGLAQAYRQTDNQVAALSTLQTWLKKHPEDTQAQLQLANLYFSLKRYDDAKAAFTQLLERAPDNPAVLNNLAWLLRQQNPQQARQYAEKALTLAPNNAAVMDTLGVILLEQGEKQRALELLRKASQQPPESRDTLYHLAKALAVNEQKDEARRILRTTLKDKTAFDSRQDAEALLKELGN
ncbi:MAG: XrtA/PEP-CTERM system TPR-repeat protein PrsT [Candidatus Competibacteraceae bacterium]